MAAHLTARWYEGVVPAIGVVAHGGPTGLDGGCWCGQPCAFWLAGANLLVVVRGAAMEVRTMQVRWNVPGSGGVRTSPLLVDDGRRWRRDDGGQISGELHCCGGCGTRVQGLKGGALRRGGCYCVNEEDDVAAVACANGARRGGRRNRCRRWCETAAGCWCIAVAGKMKRCGGGCHGG